MISRAGDPGHHVRSARLCAITSSYGLRAPAGDEAVICTGGEFTIIQELPEGRRSVVLRAGENVMNPLGVWPADVVGQAAALFITLAAAPSIARAELGGGARSLRRRVSPFSAHRAARDPHHGTMERALSRPLRWRMEAAS